MALLYVNDCGDSYDTSTGPGDTWITFPGNSSVQTVAGMGTTGKCVLNSNTIGATGPIPGSISVIMGFRFLAQATGNAQYLAVFQNGIGGTVLITITGANQISCGSLLTAPLPFNPFNSIHYYEIKCVASTTNTGTLEIRIDGALFATFNGVAIGNFNGNIVACSAGVGWSRDFIILDNAGASPWNNYLGDVNVTAEFPVADAVPNTWTNDFGGSHYLQVDSPVPPGDTAFLHSATITNEERYNFPSLPGTAQVVYGVVPKNNAKKVTGGTRTLANRYTQSATTSTGNSFAVGAGTYTEYTPDYSTINPNTGLQWTVSDFNATQFGFIVQS